MKYTTTLLSLLLSSAMMAQGTFDIEAHRGGRGLMPENSIPAFINAVHMGVNTLELDICVSKDGKLVVSHDPVMSNEICNKPVGLPIGADEKDKYKIYAMNYSEIREFDCGSRGNNRFPDQKKIKTYKPLLSEVIDSVEKYIADNGLPPVRYNIETKSTVKGDNIYNPEPAIFTKLFYDVIKDKGIISRCVMQSFDMRTLQQMHKIDPTVATALLVENASDDLETNLKDLHFNPTIYSPNYLLVTKKMISKCHSLGIKVLPWTINEIAKMTDLKAQGVDGLITDYPDRAIKALRPK